MLNGGFFNLGAWGATTPPWHQKTPPPPPPPPRACTMWGDKNISADLLLLTIPVGPTLLCEGRSRVSQRQIGLMSFCFSLRGRSCKWQFGSMQQRGRRGGGREEGCSHRSSWLLEGRKGRGERGQERVFHSQLHDSRQNDSPKQNSTAGWA